MGKELESQLEALEHVGVNLNDRHAVKAKAFELDMPEVLEALHSISHLKESKRAIEWANILRGTMPIEADIEDDLDADDTPDPTSEDSEVGASNDSETSSEGDSDPTQPSSESSESQDSEAETSEKPAMDASTSSSSTPASPEDGGESEASE